MLCVASQVRTVSFSARETDALVEGAAGLRWDSTYVAVGSRLHVDVDAVEIGGLQLARARFRARSIALGGAPPGAYVLVLSGSTPGRARLGGKELGSSRVGLIHPGKEYRFCTTGSEVMLLSVPRERFESWMQALWGRGVEGIGNGLLCADLQCGTRAQAWSLAVDEALLDAPFVAEEQALAPRIPALVEDVLRAVAPPEERPRTPARWRAAHRAEAYLQENWRLPLTLSDMCRAAEASASTLRQGFQEVYGCPPTAYLRSLRLNGARAMLRQSAPDRPVSDVALRCGFRHLGRFSTVYHRAYGEPPSRTRRG